MAHFTLMYTENLFSGERIEAGKSRDPVNRGFTVVVYEYFMVV